MVVVMLCDVTLASKFVEIVLSVDLRCYGRAVGFIAMETFLEVLFDVRQAHRSFYFNF